MNCDITINDFVFSIFEKAKVVVLRNPKEVGEAGEQLATFYEIENNKELSFLDKYPFRIALKKYKKLKVFA